MSKGFRSGNGPKTWNGAKKRMKHPQTEEAKLSQEQRVGKTFIKRRSDSVRQKQDPMKTKARLKLGDQEKRLRALNKLLRQIEELQAKSQAGETLDEQQVSSFSMLAMAMFYHCELDCPQCAKIERLNDVLEEMDALLAQGS